MEQKKQRAIKLWMTYEFSRILIITYNQQTFLNKGQIDQVLLCLKYPDRKLEKRHPPFARYTPLYTISGQS